MKAFDRLVMAPPEESPEKSPEKCVDLVVVRLTCRDLGYIGPLVGNFLDHQPLPWYSAGLRPGK
jgi:hypothetical protein